VSQQQSDVGFDSTDLATAGIDRVNEAKAMHGGPIVAMLGLIILHVLLDIPAWTRTLTTEPATMRGSK
jgi:hypothetical protein